MKESFHIFVDVFDKDKLVPGRIVRFLEGDTYVEGTVQEVIDGKATLLGDMGEVELPIEEIEYIGGMDMGSNRREDFVPKGEPKKITAEAVIAKYIETRDVIEAKEKALKEEMADLKVLQTKRENWLTTEMDKIGTDTFKAKGVGTSFFEKVDSVKMADAEVFMAWVEEDWENRKNFLENRVSKTAVKQRLEEKEPPPPGVNYTQVRVVRVRRG